MDGDAIATVFPGLQRAFDPESGFDVKKVLTDARGLQVLALGPEDLVRFLDLALVKNVFMPDGLKNAFVTNNPDHANIFSLAGVSLNRKGIRRTLKAFRSMQAAEAWLDIRDAEKGTPLTNEETTPG